jgi:ADP-heptose:LPS heptosyltransferase
MIPSLNKVKKILFIRLSSLGDIVKCVPAYRALVKSFPRAQCDWLVDVRFAGVLEGQLNDGIVVPMSGSWGFGSLLKMRKIFLANSYDLVLDAHGNIRSGVYARRTGAPVRVGFAPGFHKEGWINSLFMTHRVIPQGVIQNRKHMAMSLVRECGGVEFDEYPFLTAQSQHLKKAETFFKSGPVILIHPGGSPKGIYKRWFPDRYAALAKKLKDACNANIFLVWGNREEQVLCETIQKSSGLQVPLVPRTDLPGFMGYLAAADLVIGADSGPVHLADALGTPVVSIHGPKDPARYGPFGPRSIAVSHNLECVFPDGSEGLVCRKTDCKHRECLEKVTVDDVFSACGKTGFA